MMVTKFCLLLCICAIAFGLPSHDGLHFRRSNFVVGSLKWIREQLSAIKNGGIRLAELHSLKRYLIGYDSDVKDELDKEIDDLLSNSSQSDLESDHGVYSPINQVSN